MKNDTVELLTSWMPFSYTAEMIKESREQNNGKIIMKGILQKADTLNQNGRIYPKAILDREVRNYQKFIRERRALGECVDSETMIWTVDGWKFIKDIAEDEEIFTLNVDNHTVEIESILHKVVIPFKGSMLHFVGSGVDMMLTPSHKILLYDENKNPYVIFAEEAYQKFIDNDTKQSKSFLMIYPHIKEDKTKTGLFEKFKIDSITKISHNDFVYCVQTINRTWLAMRNDKIFWTHNCDHPESSVVELKNASHLITEAHMSDGIVYGTVELLNTPSGKILQSLVESGVTLGISSRGVGSTKREGERQIVQDDFQLICWDYVSEPSTPGAFMMRESKEIDRRQIEKFFKKSDKVDRIFNEILEWKK